MRRRPVLSRGAGSAATDESPTPGGKRHRGGVRGGVPAAAPALPRPDRGALRGRGIVGLVAEPFDDQLPRPAPLPQPGGYFEVFCCGGLVLAFFAGLVVLALVR